MMLELGFIAPGIGGGGGGGYYSRYLSGRAHGRDHTPTLMDYLPDDALLIIDESHVTVSQVGSHV